MTSTIDPLTALGTHLAEFELPAIASAHLTASPSGPRVTVRLASRAPSAIAEGPLAWADTLTETTTQAWRVPHGESVHLSVTGLPPGGAAIQIYSGLPVTDHGLGADLSPNTTRTPPLTTPRHLATPGHITKEVTL